MVDEHEGPTLFGGTGRSSAGYAWIDPGTVVSVRGGVRRGRARTVVNGPLRVRGWVDVDSLGATVLRRGRARGTPIYFSPGDYVGLRSAAGETAEIEATARFAHPRLPRSATFIGTFPLAQLGAGGAGSGEGPTAGRPVLLRHATGLHAQPGGATVLWDIPRVTPPLPAVVLRERDGWAGVRIGIGPYLVGYVPTSAFAATADEGGRKQGGPEVLDPWATESSRRSTEPAVADPWDRADDEGGAAPVPDDLLPPRLRAAVLRPVWRIPSGTRVLVRGVVVAIFDEPGYGVELAGDGDEVEVLAGCDASVTVRGRVARAGLTPAELPSTTAAEALDETDDELDESASPLDP